MRIPSSYCDEPGAMPTLAVGMNVRSGNASHAHGKRGHGTRRTLLILAACLATLLCPTQRCSAAPTPSLVPAQFSDRVDAQGFRWDVNQYQGQVGNGTNSCFSGAFMMVINGNHAQFNQQQAMMTPDGCEYVLTNRLPNNNTIELTRRIRVSPKTVGIRYIDVFRNLGATPTNIVATIPVQLGNSQYLSLMTDGGSAAPTTLGKRDSGVVMFGQPNSSQLTVALYLASAGSRVKPSIQYDGNRMRLTLVYTLSIPAGKTTAIAFGAAQCNMTAIADAKTAASLLKPFTARDWLKDVPADVAKAIINHSGGDDWGDDSSPSGLASLAADRGPTDILAIGPHTRLKGTAACSAISLETRYGLFKGSLDQVAAVLGAKREGQNSRLVLRDGQVLAGRLTIKDLRFTTGTGLSMELTTESIDRLVLRAGATDGKPAESVSAMLHTVDGERIALVAADNRPLFVTTPWGQRSFALGELARLTAAADQVGHRLVLRDGTRLFAFLDPATLTLPTLTFGPQQFSPLAIREIRTGTLSISDKNRAKEPSETVTQPHLTLAGENLLVGQIDLPAIHFLVAGQNISTPPAQIRHLRNVSNEANDEGEKATVFEVELWDGGKLTGRLSELVLPVRAGDARWQVPTADIVEAHVPIPTVPEATRAKIASLIRDLGDAEFDKRKAALIALTEIGLLAKPQLTEAARDTSDPEVRRSVQSLIEEMKE